MRRQAGGNERCQGGLCKCVHGVSPVLYLVLRDEPRDPTPNTLQEPCQFAESPKFSGFEPQTTVHSRDIHQLIRIFAHHWEIFPHSGQRFPIASCRKRRYGGGMHVAALSLSHFRNHAATAITPGAGLVILTGERTVLQYLFQPLISRIAFGMKEH